MSVATPSTTKAPSQLLRAGPLFLVATIRRATDAADQTTPNALARIPRDRVDAVLDGPRRTAVVLTTTGREYWLAAPADAVERVLTGAHVKYGHPRAQQARPDVLAQLEYNHDAPAHVGSDR